MTADSPPPRRCRYPDLYPYACPAGCYCARPITTVHLPPHPDDTRTAMPRPVEPPARCSRCHHVPANCTC